MEEIEGKKGQLRFGLRLEGTSTHKVHEVASEGEQRCIALAAFLTELSQASHKSSLVFDDPVSSLDHWYRHNIAMRLVNESKTRQVVVFTHDLLFHNDLTDHAERSGVSCKVLSLEWSASAPGKVLDGLAWDCSKPSERIDELERQQRALADRWCPVPNDQNVREMRHIYSLLRSTLEAITEREILAGVVVRMQRQINAGRIRELVSIPETECHEAKRLLQQCHEIIEGHYAPIGTQNSVPHPTQLAKDIADTKALRNSVKERRKANAGGGISLGGTAPPSGTKSGS
jgi:hypothetical protein